MPQDPHLPETPDPIAEAEPTTPTPENAKPDKVSSLKRRRINLEWKSQFGSSDGYAISKRVVLGPAIESPVLPQPAPPSTFDKTVAAPTPPEPQLVEGEPTAAAEPEELLFSTPELPAEAVSIEPTGIEVPSATVEQLEELEIPTLASPEESLSVEPTRIEAPSATIEQPEGPGVPALAPPEESLAVEPIGIEEPSVTVEQPEEIAIPTLAPPEESLSTQPTRIEGPSATAETPKDLEIPILAPPEQALSAMSTEPESPPSAAEEPEKEVIPEAELVPSTPRAEIASVRVCPYLGLHRDRTTHFTDASNDQVCYSPLAPGEIALDYQRKYCLSSDYVLCQRFPKDGGNEAAVPVLSTAPVLAAAPLYTPSAPLPVEESEPRRRSRVLDLTLWGVAILLAIVAIWSALPLLTRNSGAPAPTSAPIALIPSSTPSITPTAQATQAASATAVATLAPLVIPTASDTQVLLDLLPDSHLTGWVSSGENEPHWGDPGLNVGTLKGATYVGIIQFNLSNLPPGSKIQFAALELTGSDGSHLAQSGEWHLELMNARTDREWLQASASDIASASALASYDQTLSPADLAVGNINRFIFDDSQRQVLNDQFQYGSVTFRIVGPAAAGDNLFAWDSGAKSPLNAPALHLIVDPGPYTIVTNTPTPSNVLTAAANVVRATANATRNGTPTPFPPGVATATPGGETVFVGADTAVPANVGTAIARSVLATAVAITTGTYTPSPVGLVVIYPTATPFLISANQLATPTIPGASNWVQLRSSPPYLSLRGTIIALSNLTADCKDGCPTVFDTGGGLFGKLSSDLYYHAGLDREQYSPDLTKSVAYPIDDRGFQQVGYYDSNIGSTTMITHFSKGKAYDAAWSADGGAIVFVSQQNLGCDDLYYYDLGSRTTTRVTQLASLGCPFVKHPSWSPDGQNIVFWSSYGGAPHIWVISRGGQNLVDLTNPHLQGRTDLAETNPVWIK